MTDNPEAMLPVTQEEPVWQLLRKLCTPATAWHHEAGWKVRAEALEAAILARSTTDKDARIAELEAALEPFAGCLSYIDVPGEGRTVNITLLGEEQQRRASLSTDDFRRARQTLKGTHK